MKTDQQIHPVFPQILPVALTQLKNRLQHDYEQAYPELREIIHLVLDEEEANAWKLSSFPHLFLPDLVEAHIAKLNLQPADTRHDDIIMAHDFDDIDSYQPAFASCG